MAIQLCPPWVAPIMGRVIGARVYKFISSEDSV